MKPNIIRINDRVRVVEPLVVIRVGYPKTVADYLPEVIAKSGAALRSAIWAAGGDDGVVDKTIREIAYLVAKADGFGGTDRQLFTEVHEELRGLETYVDGLRNRYTGTYHHGSYSSAGSSWYGYEENWEPAYLDPMVCHRVATLSAWVGNPFPSMKLIDIETRNLEKIK